VRLGRAVTRSDIDLSALVTVVTLSTDGSTGAVGAGGRTSAAAVDRSSTDARTPALGVSPVVDARADACAAVTMALRASAPEGRSGRLGDA
jgi:hypothetical protein